MITELTKEQEAGMQKKVDEWETIAHKSDGSFDEKTATEKIKMFYELSKLKEPQVVFARSPKEAKEIVLKAEDGTKDKANFLDYIGIGYDADWVAFYEFMEWVGVKYKEDDAKIFHAWSEFLRSGVWATKLFENVAILIARPTTVLKDEKGSLHSNDGMAIKWSDGAGIFFWHGTRVPAKLIMDPGAVTAEDIDNEKNSEVSRAYAERLGWNKYFELADVQKISFWKDPKTGLEYELYDYKNRKGELQPRLLRMRSPELKDGTKPHYIEPVPPEVKSAQAARKWQAPKTIVRGEINWPSVDECNKNPELEYAWEA